MIKNSPYINLDNSPEYFYFTKSRVKSSKYIKFGKLDFTCKQCTERDTE